MPCLSVAVEEGQPEQAPFIVEIDDPVAEALEDDVAAVAGDRGADPRLDQLLDRLDRLGVLGVEEFVAPTPRRPPVRTGAPERKNSVTTPSTAGLSWLPLAVVLGHRNEVGGEEHAADAGQLHQRLGERRALGFGRVARLERAGFEHRAAGQELEGRRVGRRFGLDEHRRLLENEVLPSVR